MTGSRAFRPGGFGTIAEALDYAAHSEADLQFFSARGELEHRLGYRELRVRALACAHSLVNLDLAPGRPAGGALPRGSRVALIAATSPEFLALFYGCQYAGLVPCPLPFLTYAGGRDAYVLRLAQLSKAAGARLICAPDALLDIAGQAGAQIAVPACGFEALAGAVPAGVSASGRAGSSATGAGRSPLRADELAYVQFSSGSTALPKGVPVTQAAVSSHARIVLQHGMELTGQDRAFSWLPFYHDMGLFGFSIAPLSGQCPVDYLAPAAFARRPNLWVELMSQQGSTISYAPTFGYRLAVQRFDRGDWIDLSQLRVAGIGGDMIRADVLQQFASTFAPAGFRPSAFMPSYGMAEATLAISFARGVFTDRIDSQSLSIGSPVVPLARSDGTTPSTTRSNGHAPSHAPSNGNTPNTTTASSTISSGVPTRGALAGPARHFVICGRIIPEHEVLIVDQNARPLGERHVGRILVRGPGIMSGYDNHPQASAQVMGDDGFMDTGDLGYMIGDQLVVTGRTKDVMHLRGRNIWPEDIEWVVERIAPLRPGDVAAIAIAHSDEEDRLVCLVQGQIAAGEPRDALRRQIVAAVSEAMGIECEVVLLAPKSLPYTSSGKLARAAARAAYMAGTMTRL